MCGITGFVGIDDEPLLRAMCASLVHRGPDDAGFYTAPGVGLAMRRLAIIDLRTGGQPIANETRDVWVVFNGEIYNYGELRARLMGRGHVLATTSDTETIVHLYEDHGLDFVQHLRGMFALALWDVRRHRLVLARDRIGEKPLYYARVGASLLFGSEIKAILQARRARAVDPQAVCDYLAAGYVGGSRTFFEGILKLPPAHLLVHEAGTTTVQRYWRPALARNGSPGFPAAAAELSDRLNETVQLCLKSDVEVGAFLSGGIDSSVIVALMRKHNARVQTFSVGYGGDAAGFNELTYARRVADHLGTQHHELILGPHSSLELLPRILWHYDEPHGEPTSVLVYLLAEFTRRRLKVALSGTGGDEIFFGYPRHAGIRLLQYYRWLPAFLRKQVIERVVMKWPESTRGSRFAKRVKRLVGGSDLPVEHAYLSWVSLIQADVRAALLSAQVRSQAENPAGDDFLREYLTRTGDRPLLAGATALDVEGYLPEYQLTYVDRMSMAHGLEVRAPLCDFELVDFVTSLPDSYRLRGRRSKHIFKEVARQWIPRAIAERPKVGFDSPVGQWFKGELRPFLATFLSRGQVARSGLLDGDAVQALVRDHLSGRRDYSLQLWSLIALEGWYRMYIEDGITSGEGYGLEDLRGAGQRHTVLAIDAPRLPGVESDRVAMLEGPPPEPPGVAEASAWIARLARGSGPSRRPRDEAAFVLRPEPQTARLRLFCFPYAGGGASTYRPWTEGFPPDVEVYAVRLPGREGRFSETPATRMADLVDPLRAAIRPYRDVPFAFFGHSMGALVAFELARELRRQNDVGPVHVFVSAHRAPHRPARGRPVHRLPDTALVDEVRRRWEGIPPEVLQAPDLLELMLPTLRADLTVVETYVYEAGDPLDCPISCFGGTADPSVGHDDLAAWRDQTRSAFTFRLFAGGHFFFHDAREELLRALVGELCSLGQPTGASTVRPTGAQVDE